MANKHWAYSAGEGMVSLAFGLMAGIVKVVASLCVFAYKMYAEKKVAKKVANVVIGPSSQTAVSVAPVVAGVAVASTPLTTATTTATHDKPVFLRGYGQSYGQRRNHAPIHSTEHTELQESIVGYDELIQIQEDHLAHAQVQDAPSPVIDPYQPGMVEGV